MQASPLPLTVATGMPFADAKTLIAAVERQDQAGAKAILSKYGITDPRTAPFLKNATFVSHLAPKVAPPAAATPITAQGATAPSSIFSASSVANALGTLIATRVKQDAEILALQTLAKSLQRANTDYSHPLDQLLPATMKYLGRLNPSAADPAMWSIFQSSVRQDLQTLPNDLPGFLESLTPQDEPVPFALYFPDMAAQVALQLELNTRTPYGILDDLGQSSSEFCSRQQAVLTQRLVDMEASESPKVDVTGLTIDDRVRNEESRIAARMKVENAKIQALQTANASTKALQSVFEQDQHAETELAGRALRQQQFTRVDAAVQALVVLSHATATDTTGTWANSSDLEQYLDTVDTTMDGTVIVASGDPFWVLLGLSYANDRSRYASIEAALSESEKTSLQSMDARQLMATLEAAAGPILDALARVHNDEQYFKQVINKNYDVADLQPLAVDLGATFADLASGISTIDTGAISGEDQSRLELWQGELYTLTQIAVSSHAGDYLQAASSLVIELPEIFIAAGVQVDSNGRVSNPPQILVLLEQSGPLLGSLAAAKSQQDFSAALDAYALPAGSFARIQNEKRSWTLNSFFGGEAGAELLTGSLSDTSTHRLAARLGLAAPVGIAYNWGTPGASKTVSGGSHTGSQSIFVSVLDIGAVASFRLQHGNGGQVPAFKWSNIVAPGVFYAWTLRNTPLCFLVGTQYGPELRQITSAGGTTLERAAWQPFVLGFTFNIPLFQLSGENAYTSGP